MPVATGSTLTFSGLTASIMKISWGGFAIDVYDDSVLSTVAWKVKEAGALAEAKPLTVTVKYKTGLIMPAPRTKATLTLTPSSSAPAISASAIFSGLSDLSAETETDMTATLTFELTGAVTIAGSTMTPVVGALNV